MAGIKCRKKLKEIHTVGCQVFFLQNDLQECNTITKLSPFFWLGVNLGPSLLNTCNISFVLNISTILVCSQYHVRHDEFFETIHYWKRDISIPSKWQWLAGLLRSIGDNSPEMHDLVHQDNEAYVPEGTTNMAHNVWDHPQVTRFESTKASNTIKTNLVSTPDAPQVHGSEKLQSITNMHMITPDRNEH